MIGDYPAQSFFHVDSITGAVTTINNLRLDAQYASVYVVRVTAVYNQRPNKVATSTVHITVIRNPNSPQFTHTSYTNTISEITDVGSVVLIVTVTDLDVNLNFMACDNGLPRRCAYSNGTIFVTRNQFPPIFLQEPYSRTIAKTFNLEKMVLTLTAQDNNLIAILVYEAVITITSYPFEVNNLFYGPNVYSFPVRTFDTADPLRTDKSNVTITIIQNPSGPRFLENPYLRTTPTSEQLL